MTTNQSTDRWPEGAFVYQIYPRSFQDSNGDGIGDLNGITSRLGYLQGLGITAIWLSPFYPSPMADFGYDVSDYCNVDPIFGTLEDFKQLMAEAGKRNIKVIIDLVPNHSSDEHDWFKQSRASKATTNPYHDWYIWRDGIRLKPGQTNSDGSQRPEVPNNWRDVLSGASAWEWDETRKQYYLHSFHVKQPDLNWSNPAVRAAIKSAMRFWLDMGVDGFRVDAVYSMAKEPLLTDDPVNPNYVEGEDLPYDALKHENSRGWPAMFAYLSGMANVLKEPAYKDKQRFMVTESYPEGPNPLVEYLNFYVGMDPMVAAPFNFEGLSMGWDALAWRKFLRSFHSALGQIDPHCVASYAFGNHDQPRIASRLGTAAARSAAVLLLTLPGMVFLYYGDELAMKNVVIPRDRVRDPAAEAGPAHGQEYGQGRDPERTPMQWSGGPSAGFTDGPNTWLPLAADYKQHNVETEQADSESMLNLYKALGQLRSTSDTLRHGTIEVLNVHHPSVLGYARCVGAEQTADSDYAVFINFSNKAVTCPVTAAIHVQLGDRLISSRPGWRQDPVAESYDMEDFPVEVVELQPHEAVVYAVLPEHKRT